MVEDKKYIMKKETKKIIYLYSAYLIAIICNIVPSSIIQSLGLILFLVIFITTYVYKYKSQEDSVTYSHMTYIIKTIYISSLWLLIGMVLAYYFADHMIIHQAIQSLQNGMPLTENDLNRIMMNYLKQNIEIFTLTLSPSLIYLIYRFGKGIIIAQKDSVIHNPKNWF